MTTRNLNKDLLIPLSDPEAIIRTSNAERRRHAQLNTLLWNRAAIGIPLPSSPKQTIPLQIPTVSPSNRPPHVLTMTNEDRQSGSGESAHSNIKTETSPPNSPAKPKSNRIDLRHFRLDGPKFQGPFQAVEPFLNWIQGVQIHFTTRAITNNDDKLHVIGTLLEETNLLSLYANEVGSYMGKPWSDFKARLFEYSLPQLWREDLEEKAQHLAMMDSETFITYSTRARTLQSMINFNKVTLLDCALAKLVVYGLPRDLKAKVREWQLLEATNFKYPTFEQRCCVFYKTLPRRRFQPANPSSPLQTYDRNDPDFVWRIHAYLDLVGRCHFCKKYCGNAAGTTRKKKVT
ncbi:hypothetical protein PTTG_10098 [Puccinia triticina 1-1 BBBD Race 1]|uniref:Retrotransposon gag domain-containing protein n=1 Tax=Puccinia triticina (isolate 1-1 / race 1 (BBBD)) TaxID=630390 RepID=A0A180G1Y7_PUCT1|nr:hypothetical protein PTTG_10098 [Puccinia triticina 1-1 BBBD Race 1]